MDAGPYHVDSRKAAKMKTKQCTKCENEKDKSEFSKNSKNADGLRYWCRKCCSNYEKKYRQTEQGKQATSKAGKKYRKTPMGCFRHCFQAIKQRCNNPKAHNYKHYGGRGIKCLFKSSDEFISYVLNKLQIDSPHGFDIDRINNDGNYEPGNIRFVTHAENLRNKHRRQ